MRTSIQLDRSISKKLKILAEHENRTKVDEIRFLVKKELESLNISRSKPKRNFSNSENQK